MKVEINAPNVAAIGITGPVQCGKSLILHRIKEVLTEEFGATVILNDELQQDFNGMDYSKVDDWQKKIVKKTVWVLAE